MFVAELSTLIQKKKMRILVNNRAILLTVVDGFPYAIQDKCPHMGSSLFRGVLEKEMITCKEHRLGISVISGEVSDKHKADFLKIDEYSRQVKTYKTVVIESKVYIEI